MARDFEQAERRRRELAKMLSQDQGVSTVKAARRFGVSPMTIRRDLKVLEDSGLAVRCYGGAVGAHRITLEFAFDNRHRSRLDEKRRIGAAAAEGVKPGEMVFLDTGTTTLEVGRALARRNVLCRVATSSLVVASELWGREHIELLLLGGRARRGSPDLAGPGTEVMLDRLAADVAFLGSDGVDPVRGCYSEDIETARVSERMAANASRVVVVMDHTKLGFASGTRHLQITDVDELITDSGADKEMVAALQDKGVRVTLV
jgi:DeoR/GlpR family transcriptional regulator of sugar metabolism